MRTTIRTVTFSEGPTEYKNIDATFGQNLNQSLLIVRLQRILTQTLRMNSTHSFFHISDLIN
jgi:hypothetical protein